MAGLTNQQMKKEAETGTGKMYAIEYNGQLAETNEKEHQSHVRRREELQKKEKPESPLDKDQQSGFFSINKPGPVPPA